MDHSSQDRSLTPFITWFVYLWKVTLCLHLLMKLSTISHLRRETSGKDCGWWVIDELDQFILWYIHILVQKRRWTSKMGILHCLCVFRVCEWLQLFLKPTRNVQSIRLQCSWEPMKSHHNFQCRSLIQPKYHYFSSYFLPILINLPHLVTSL